MKYLTVSILCISLIPYVGVAWAHHSIDGDFTPGASVTITLAADADIASIHIYGRSPCCIGRQNDFDLVIGNAGQNEILINDGARSAKLRVAQKT